jgi:uncharacterized protein YjiS (DUF1127 family)
MAFISTHRSRTALPKTVRLTLFDLISLYRQRRALARLDDRALEDIGITRAEADAEARSGFWDVPNHWVK